MIYCLDSDNLNLFGKLCRLHRNPVLIGGCGRSGTTLLMSVLSCHPRILCIEGEQSPFCPTGYHADINPDARFCMDKLCRSVVDSGIPEKTFRWCEKTPRNILFIPRILEYFGTGCRFIHLVRDGRDVTTSRHPKDPSRFWISPERWVKDVSAGLEYQNHPQVHTVRYEDLIMNFDVTIGQIYEFLDESSIPSYDTFPESAQVNTLTQVTMGHQVRKPHSDSIGRWREAKYSGRIADFMACPGAPELLDQLGYPKE